MGDRDTTTASLTLVALGWTPERTREFSGHAASGLVPGRVTSSSGRTIAQTEAGATEVILQRRSAREASSAAELPTVGDWLALQPVADAPRQAALREVLTRRSAFVRQRPSDGRPQVLAANVDVAFIVAGLDLDLNVRRIERYLVLALDGGVTPVVVLNKADVAVDLAAAVSAVHAVAAGTRVIVASALTGVGLDELLAYLDGGTTACLLGSSGVGKSTLTNRLLGEERQAVRTLREDDSKGRHTTTHRELFALPDGGLLIDTPGLRTVGVLEDAGALESAFDEIAALAASCRFSDCRHEAEPGCAVLAALETGTLSAERYASHQQLEAERRSVALRADARARREADRQLGRYIRRAAKDAVRHKRGEY